MKHLSLRNRLLRYLLKQHGWVHSGDLQRLVMENTTYLPRTTVRRLQELCDEGTLEVRYENRAALYRAKEGVEMPKQPNENFIVGVGILKSY